MATPNIKKGNVSIIDMETWEVAVDAIEGTGERLTHCFIREDAEIYYRVEESP